MRTTLTEFSTYTLLTMIGFDDEEMCVEREPFPHSYVAIH